MAGQEGSRGDGSVDPRGPTRSSEVGDPQGLLILTRKQGESIYIGDDIEIRVTGIRPGQVRIGIKAPPEVQILRKEVRDRDRAAGSDDD